MDKQLKDKWIAALESGEFKKGKQFLRRVDNQGIDRYCCLGVLAEVLNLPKNKRKEFVVYNYFELGYKLEDNQSKFNEKEPGFCSFLPPGISDRVGLSDQLALAIINDQNETFTPVIEFIKKNL